MKLVGWFIFLILIDKSLYALSLTDFVPSFAESSSSKTESLSQVKPFVDIKRNASSNSTWYCTRMQNTVSNVFCSAESGSVVPKVGESGRNNPLISSETGSVVDNAVVSNGALTQSMSQRTSTFQDPKVSNLLMKNQDQIQNSVMVPLQPSKNVHVDVNGEQVQFNIQY